MGRRKLSSTAYLLRKNINKLINYRPPPYLIAALLMFAAIILFSGVVYDLSTSVRSVIPYYRGFLLLYPSLHEQTLSESIAIMIIYALGAAGLLLIYQSIRYRRNPNQASLLIRLGTALLIVAFITLEAVLYMWKIGLGF